MWPGEDDRVVVYNLLPNYFSDNLPAARNLYHLPSNNDRTNHRHMAKLMDNGVRVMNNADCHKFAIQVDVVHVYEPNEIDVKVQNKQLIVSGKHELVQVDEHNGFVSNCTFTRHIALPEDVDEKQLTCNMSEHGVLTFEAPRLAVVGSKSRAIPITHVTADGNLEKKLG